MAKSNSVNRHSQFLHFFLFRRMAYAVKFAIVRRFLTHEKTNAPLFRRLWRHQLTQRVENYLELVIVPTFQRLKFTSQLSVRRQELA